MRLEAEASAGTAEGWIDGLEKAGYVGDGRADDPEQRFHHPGGSICRIFPATRDRSTDILYAYPPGGTKRPTGDLEPFTPFKKHIAGINGTRHRSNAQGQSADETTESGASNGEADPTDADPSAEKGESSGGGESVSDADGSTKRGGVSSRNSAPSTDPLTSDS